MRNNCENIALEQVPIQPMTSGLGEILLGFRRDPDAGPIVLIAAGGVYTEIYRDRSIRLAPVDVTTAHAMIDELAISRIFKGFRNKPPGDLDALARAIVAMSGLADDAWSDVIDAEINPLIIRPASGGAGGVYTLIQFARQGDKK